MFVFYVMSEFSVVASGESTPTPSSQSVHFVYMLGNVLVFYYWGTGRVKPYLCCVKGHPLEI